MVLILNRLYYFFSKIIGRVAPFNGAVTLTSLLIISTCINIRLAIYAFRHEPNIIGFIVFFLIYAYAKTKKKEIVKADIKYATEKKFLVAFPFLFTLFAFLFLSNLNRKKIEERRLITVYDIFERKTLLVRVSQAVPSEGQTRKN